MKNLACSQPSLNCQVVLLFVCFLYFHVHESSKYLSKHNKINILFTYFMAYSHFYISLKGYYILLLKHKVEVKSSDFMYMQ